MDASEPLFQHVDGERASIDRLARWMSLAMQKPGIRQQVQADMRKSRVREHKLELRAYLQSDAGDLLLQALAEAAEQERADVTALIESIRPLEFYVPVPQHRARWTGRDEVIVAWQLEDELPAYFYAEGAQPVFIGPNQIPETPVVSLVPVETDFSDLYGKEVQNVVLEADAIGTYEAELASSAMEGSESLNMMPDDCEWARVECDPTGGGGGGDDDEDPTPPPTFPYDGLYFEAMTIHDDNEPSLTKGSPEIDVYAAGTLVGLYEDVSDPDDPFYYLAFSPSAVRLLDMDCAGSEASGIREFDFNSEITHDSHTVLFAQGKSFAIHEEVTSTTGGHVLLKRVVPAKGPFEISIWERDDGNQCPDGRKTVEINFTISFRWAGGWDIPEADGFGWADFAWMWGGDNDLVARWTFSNLDEVIQANGWLGRSGDGNLKVVNHDFDRNDIPPYSEEWFVPGPY